MIRAILIELIGHIAVWKWRKELKETRLLPASRSAAYRELLAKGRGK